MFKVNEKTYRTVGLVSVFEFNPEWLIEGPFSGLRLLLGVGLQLRNRNISVVRSNVAVAL